MIISSSKNVFSDGAREIILHKSQMVEAVAGLHSLYVKNDEKLGAIRNFAARFAALDEKTRYSLQKYGENYAGWLLIMDVATYLSCKYYDETGDTYLSFEKAVAAYDELDEVTFTYIFLGMPALGYSKEDAARWLRDPASISARDFKEIGQYVSPENVAIFIRNAAALKDDLSDLLVVYWEKVFRGVWEDVNLSLDKTIDTAAYECRLLGDSAQYIANVHKDIKVSKGNVYVSKEAQYVISLEKIKKVSIFPSAFSGKELLIDTFDDSLVIYYNLNLLDSKQVGEDGKRLCKIFKILGDDTRLKIARMLWGAPATTQYLAGMLGMSPSTVSTHLKMMRTAGLVTNKAVKKFVYYEINQEIFEKLGPDLLEYMKK